MTKRYRILAAAVAELGRLQCELIEETHRYDDWSDDDDIAKIEVADLRAKAERLDQIICLLCDYINPDLHTKSMCRDLGVLAQLPATFGLFADHDVVQRGEA
jgi:hypothetical protein